MEGYNQPANASTPNCAGKKMMKSQKGPLVQKGVATGPTLPHSVHIFISLHRCFCCFQVASLTVEI